MPYGTLLIFQDQTAFVQAAGKLLHANPSLGGTIDFTDVLVLWSPWQVNATHINKRFALLGVIRADLFISFIDGLYKTAVKTKSREYLVCDSDIKLLCRKLIWNLDIKTVIRCVSI